MRKNIVAKSKHRGAGPTPKGRHETIRPTPPTITTDAVNSKRPPVLFFCPSCVRALRRTWLERTHMVKLDTCVPWVVDSDRDSHPPPGLRPCPRHGCKCQVGAGDLTVCLLDVGMHVGIHRSASHFLRRVRGCPEPAPWWPRPRCGKKLN